MNYKDVNDYEVLYMVRENDDNAQELLLKKYLPLIHKVSAKYSSYAKNHGVESDDLVQEGFIALSKACHTYREDSGVLFFTYARLCIERHLITYCRNMSSNRHYILNHSVGEENFCYMKNFQSDPEEIYLHFYEEKEFVQYKNSLDLEYSSILELRYNGFSYKEISRLLDIPVSTVDGRIYKMRKALQNKTRKYA